MHLTQLVFRAEQLRGTAPAVDDRGQSLNWAQTADRVRRMAGALQALGIRSNDRVAILSLNSRLYYESLFGIPQIGARIVPLNIRWALPEFTYSVNDSGSTAMLFDQTFLPVVEQLRQQETPIQTYLYLGDAAECPDWARHLESLMTEAEPLTTFVHGDDHMAGIFYTGGTTGFPKGVMLTHGALFASALSLAAAAPADENSSVLHAAPMFHLADLATCFMFTVLAARHAIVPAFEPVTVMNAIEAAQVSDALLVPAMIQMLFDHPEFSAAKLSGLQRILYGASPMPEGLLRRVMAALPGIQMTQAYGQTEMAPVVTVLLPEDHVTEGERARLLRSAGRSSYSCLIRIVDEQGQEQPVGSVGEVCVTGPNMMLGYWNKPEQTAETIRDGWIHTGDAGYLDDAGYLFLVDRIKDMIVTGGENVYSAEVESVVSTHPSVAQVAVVGIPSQEWGEAVHAIIVPKADADRDEQAIIEHCKARMAHFKCPKRVEFRDEPLPLSGAGKVLKRELRAPYWEGHDRQVN